MKVKPAKAGGLGTHLARHVVDTKGKVCFARTFHPQQENLEREKKPHDLFLSDAGSAFSKREFFPNHSAENGTTESGTFA